MSPANLKSRHAADAVSDALADTRVVLVNGARQAGKSTLVRSVSGTRDATWRDLDRPDDRQAAIADPVGFVEDDGLMVIDEIQRVPDLLLPIKVAVDADPRPGRYLLTGSSRLLGLRDLPDTLPGRMETIELWPFSQGEIDGSTDGFVDAVFRNGPAVGLDSEVSRLEYTERVVRGGFPEAVARADPRRRGRFLDNYVQNLIERDVRQLSDIERAPQLATMVRLMAARSATLVSAGSLAGELELARGTIQRYLQLLEEIFLIKRIPGWSRNVGTRLTSAAKLVFVDSGVAARMLAADAHTLRRPGGQLGPLLEGFVISEVARQLTWCETPVELYHYRDQNKVEVDMVLEDRSGAVVGIEVKAASTVKTEDFRGLRILESKLGDEFVAGIVLYTGGHTLPFGPKLRAMPISALWEL
ncbi:ATP-binding protein [Nocardia yamanashiensis]|uniref:ATP-binding protein n=1 Tax=Nocardia yamanashiensis TaxID=209247 RepID=UPI000832EC76|nr:ATP-binding protein [Nocardia yamanashiensis]